MSSMYEASKILPMTMLGSTKSMGEMKIMKSLS